MSPNLKKQCRQTLTTDVLSNLPENVIDDILMCLPFQDAVRTSILSKKWRYIWCRLPKLTLDETLWTTQKDLRSLNIYFTKIIFNIFTFHSGPITTFTLCIPHSGMCTKIDNLIYFLFRNGIEYLCRKSYKLPSSFFTCLHLKHLTLEGCLILPPPSFKGFDKLTSLELRGVKISSELLESLISGCPLLEHLALKISYTLRSVIEINAPILKSFDFDGNIRSICLKPIPLLEKLSLAHWGWYDWANKFCITKFFESFSALQHLHLSNIITLKVDNSVVVAPESHEVEGFSDVTFNHLMEIKLEGIIGKNPQMQLIKLLLAKSPVLVRMKIESWLSVNSASDSSSEKTKNLQESKLLAEISKFQRASPKAEVIVKSLLV
ncbi:PREDICTED: F-box/FBD/LRR-repeat protein At1g13570-like isoform X2 [Nicotiana attenuata]|uniref:F-box/FBD/LRR-repeat protein At1g13570-like isoform X2 n=1 Tax=Nicotiana attenuata TaxID=49451 RepID=UPI000904ED68|nr:PREDICTED: F-box/FBD/LRR-repeat protein At1g13570-like isoform X2 [Nicotiana attenuata]